MKSLIEISDDTLGALKSISEIVLSYPFTQPKAHLLRCIESYYSHKSSKVRSLALSCLNDIVALDDPILNLAVANTPEKLLSAMVVMIPNKGSIILPRKQDSSKRESATVSDKTKAHKLPQNSSTKFESKASTVT
jgi:hypothetical protein